MPMKILLGYLFLILTTLSVSATGVTHEVLIMESADNQSLLFRPLLLKANAGDAVTFRSELAGHATRSVFVPDGANTWVNDLEARAAVRLNKEGIYIYECRFHDKLGMAGVILVGNAKNLEAAKAFYKKYKKKFIVNRDRLDNIIGIIER